MKKKLINSLIPLAMAAAVCVPTVLPNTTANVPLLSDVSVVQMIDAEAVNYGRLYDQKNWSTSTTLNSQLQSSGCGIFSFANAIYALNGKKVDITSVATWAKGNKSWVPGGGGLWRWRFFGNDLSSGNVAAKYGNTYNFKIDGCYDGKITDSKLTNHLKNGGVAVIHVYNHFMTVTAYDGKYYYVVESYPTNGRGLSSSGWVGSGKLTSGKTNVDWYCLISSKGTNPTPTPTTTNCFKKYTGSSTSIVTALNAIGVDSSYNYRKQIAAANNISNYSGTASQNTTMLNKLKAGTLKKPTSTPAPTPVVNYFKKYTGSSASIVTALNAIGADSSYSYRKQIAAANSISNYSGTASQNTTMLNKLKSGTLKKP
ncbi:MAG: DUF3597 domain-containing protein [Lachnospiraceae bacterium]|nr:DUF3597 domain-containing protein [Lachnospiraceae bacterium]MCM1231187.1 DUF3597 domain-containing protein [Ruminococcus flavefaciens]